MGIRGCLKWHKKKKQKETSKLGKKKEEERKQQQQQQVARIWQNRVVLVVTGGTGL